jgi:hypothetical protein
MQIEKSVTINCEFSLPRLMAIHSLSNDIHTHLIKAVGHEDKVDTAESKLCNEQKQIHSKPIQHHVNCVWLC